MADRNKGKNLIRLKCSGCKRNNYYIWRKRTAETKLAIKKFCKWCKKNTTHKESKR